MTVAPSRSEARPGEWAKVTPDELKAWRRTLRKGYRREINTASRNLPRTDAEGDIAVMERPAPTKIRDARDTMESVAKMMMDWFLSGTREQHLARAKLMKAMNPGLAHLSDEDLIRDAQSLFRKLAQESAEQVYASQGWAKPVRLDGNTRRSR